MTRFLTLFVSELLQTQVSKLSLYAMQSIHIIKGLDDTSFNYCKVSKVIKKSLLLGLEFTGISSTLNKHIFGRIVTTLTEVFRLKRINYFYIPFIDLFLSLFV